MSSVTGPLGTADDGTLDTWRITRTVMDIVDECRALVIRLLSDGGLTIWDKFSGSGHEPVTSIDMAVHEYFVREAQRRLTGLSCISEEGSSSFRRALGDDEVAAVIDPIDGTKAMVRGSPEFATCIGLLHGLRPLAGFMSFPVLDQSVVGIVGRGTTLNGSAVRATVRTGAEPRIVISPKQLTSPVLARLRKGMPEARFRPLPAFSPKALAILSGRADAGLFLPGQGRRFAVWDVLAGAIALTEAGFSIADLRGEPLVANCLRMLSDGVFYSSSGWVAGPEELCRSIRRLVAS